MIALVAVVTAMLLQSSAAAPRTIDRGTNSTMDAEKQVTVRTAAEWSALWRQHAPDRPQPSVDFSKEMVVAVFLGTRNSAGYSVEILSVDQGGPGALTVRYRQQQPSRGAITAQVITSPYHIVAVPKSSAEVKFEKVE